MFRSRTWSCFVSEFAVLGVIEHTRDVYGFLGGRVGLFFPFLEPRMFFWGLGIFCLQLGSRSACSLGRLRPAFLRCMGVALCSVWESSFSPTVESTCSGAVLGLSSSQKLLGSALSNAHGAFMGFLVAVSVSFSFSRTTDVFLLRVFFFCRELSTVVSLIRPKRIYFSKHFCCCFSSNLHDLIGANMD